MPLRDAATILAMAVLNGDFDLSELSVLSTVLAQPKTRMGRSTMRTSGIGLPASVVVQGSDLLHLVSKTMATSVRQRKLPHEPPRLPRSYCAAGGGSPAGHIP
jgi:hypothetical protein